jgi:hypothetical protein
MGGCYKERACVEASVSLPLRWRFGSKVPPEPEPYLYLVAHSATVGIVCPFPVRSPPSPRPAQLASSRPRMPCHSLPPPQPGFSSFPVSVNSHFPPCPYHYPLPSSISFDLQISNPIPSGQTPNTLSMHLANRTVPKFGSLTSHVGNGPPPPDLRSRLNQALSHLFFLLLPPSSPTSSQRPCPRQLPPS